MARYTGPVCRLCRRAGDKLMLKGERCSTLKCAWEKRAVPPGARRSGRRPRRVSERGLQLREKQKVRQTYGVLEKQMRIYFAKAKRAPGLTGNNLLQLLERRLDNIVFRLGFASSRAQARQVVNHGHITVNGRKVDIPSYLVRPGDVVAWGEKARETDLHRSAAEAVGGRFVPNWLSLDTESLSGQMLTLPDRSEMEVTFDDKAVVAYYTR